MPFGISTIVEIQFVSIHSQKADMSTTLQIYQLFLYVVQNI